MLKDEMITVRASLIRNGFINDSIVPFYNVAYRGFNGPYYTYESNLTYIGVVPVRLNSTQILFPSYTKECIGYDLYAFLDGIYINEDLNNTCNSFNFYSSDYVTGPLKEYGYGQIIYPGQTLTFTLSTLSSIIPEGIVVIFN